MCGRRGRVSNLLFSLRSVTLCTDTLYWAHVVSLAVSQSLVNRNIKQLFGLMDARELQRIRIALPA